MLECCNKWIGVKKSKYVSLPQNASLIPFRLLRGPPIGSCSALLSFAHSPKVVLTFTSGSIRLWGLFLRTELWRPNIIAPQFDAKYTLEVAEDLLVGSGSALLIV